MNKVYILVGVPGSGKSTWIKGQNFDPGRTVVASTDNYVEQQAELRGKTYSEVFEEVMPAAVVHMADTVVDAVEAEKDIVWDQTSTTPHTRAKKLRMIPGHYQKIAVVFPTPQPEELERRLAGRAGKTIPPEVVQDMIKGYIPPTIDEGFDLIITAS